MTPTATDRCNVSCPFCGLACDDLTVGFDAGVARVRSGGCARSIELFAASSASAECSITGRPATLAEAAAHAAGLLRGAGQPLFGGMAADVGGVRAALRLADRVGAVVDHMNTRGLMRNLLTLQDSGWIASTFAEVRTRADFVLVVGTDLTTRFPRVVERLIAPVDSPFHEQPIARRVVCLGAPAVLPGARVIDCPKPRLGEVVGALRALLADRPIQATSVAGIAIETLRELAAQLRDAKYGIVAWAAADLDVPHGELVVQSLCALVADLNETTRCGGLPLGGNDGDVTANQVTAWQTGFPLRTGFARGVPDYDPLHFATERLLERGDADLLLWIAALDPARLPPAAAAPTVVLGHPAMRFVQPPEVFIPVATPGLHHAGHCFRSDSVMAVRLRQLTDSPLPPVAAALAAIEQAL